MTAHWIEVRDSKWLLRSEVVGFQPLSGEHSGWNLGRYFVGLCDRVGIFNKNGSKAGYLISLIDRDSTKITLQLFTVTLDNTSNNNTTCETIKTFHKRRLYELWNAKENQLPYVSSFFQVWQGTANSNRCFAHVVNSANVAVMTHITKIATVETTTAIWEYDPSLLDNTVLGGSLDVIAAIRTVAIKVCYVLFLFIYAISAFRVSQIQASGQRIEYFEKLQIQCKIPEPLSIPLHSNVRWGSAYHMLNQAYKLRQVS